MKPLLFNTSFLSHVGTHVSHDTDRKLNEKEKITETQYQELLDIKRDRARLENSRLPLYRNIGFTVSLLLVLLAFNWKVPNEQLVDLGQLEVTSEEIYDIPISEQPPPPPPSKAEVFEIVEVDDTEIIEEMEVSLDVEVSEDTKIADVIVDLQLDDVEEEVASEVFTIVEEAPTPVGGDKAFLKYLAENIKYPSSAARLNISGRVFVKFVVEKDGSLSDFQVVKGIGAGCDEEAVRVLAGAPKWNPGKQRGMPVRVYKMIPILFKLQGN